MIPPQAKIREAEKRVAALTPTEELPNSDEARLKAIVKQEAVIARVRQSTSPRKHHAEELCEFQAHMNLRASGIMSLCAD